MNKAELIAEEKKLETELLALEKQRIDFWAEVASKIQDDWIDSGRVCDAPLSVLVDYAVMPVKTVEITIQADVSYTADVETLHNRFQRGDQVYYLTRLLEEETEAGSEIKVKVKEL